jgi:hypothetical protein
MSLYALMEKYISTEENIHFNISPIFPPLPHTNRKPLRTAFFPSGKAYMKLDYPVCAIIT